MLYLLPDSLSSMVLLVSLTNLHFYAPPQQVAGYYVIPSEILSVCPSVRPSAVHHLCPLYSFDTVRDNFTKLGTDIKHDQMMCRD